MTRRKKQVDHLQGEVVDLPPLKQIKNYSKL